MSRKNLKTLGKIAGKRKDFEISLPKQNDAAYMWKGASLHPMQALQNLHQRTVREAVRKIEGDDAKRDEASNTLGAFFYFDVTSPKLLPPQDISQDAEFIEERLDDVAKKIERVRTLIKIGDNIMSKQEAGASIKKILKSGADELDAILQSIPNTPRITETLRTDQLSTINIKLEGAEDGDQAEIKRIADSLSSIIERTQNIVNGISCIANFHVIDTFYLWRLLIKYRFSSDNDISSDEKAMLSGEVTGLLHNGKNEATGWLTRWLSEKLVELDKALKALDSENLYFYLKGGRALYYAMKTPKKGTNDFDTGIIINPYLPVDQWYELFRKVHNLCLRKLRLYKHELIALMEQHNDDFSNYLEGVILEDEENGPPENNELVDDDHEDESDFQAKRLADALQLLEPLEQRTNGKAELIDIGIPRRDTPEIWETWALKKDGMEKDGMPFPGPVYYINEYVMMIRDAFQPKSRSGKKSGKRLKRLSDLIETDTTDEAVKHELDHMPASLLPKSIAALEPYNKFDKAAKVLLKQFSDAYLLREDTGFCYAFDDFFVKECGEPDSAEVTDDIREAARRLGDDEEKALSVAKNVGCFHAFSSKIEKHIQDRGDFFKKNRKEFGRFVKAIYTASIFNKPEDELEIMFAITGSFAARLHAEYADFEHMEDIEPFHRLDLKVYCKGDADPDVVMEVVVPAIAEAYCSHPETPAYMPSGAPSGALNIYWPTEEKIGELTYRPLVIRLSVEKRVKDWPQLSFVWGYPVLSIRDLAWDYIREAGLTEEVGAKARLRKTADSLSDILTCYENPGTGQVPIPTQSLAPDGHSVLVEDDNEVGDEVEQSRFLVIYHQAQDLAAARPAPAPNHPAALIDTTHGFPSQENLQGYAGNYDMILIYGSHGDVDMEGNPTQFNGCTHAGNITNFIQHLNAVGITTHCLVVDFCFSLFWLPRLRNLLNENGVFIGSTTLASGHLSRVALDECRDHPGDRATNLRVQNVLQSAEQQHADVEGVVNSGSQYAFLNNQTQHLIRGGNDGIRSYLDAFHADVAENSVLATSHALQWLNEHHTGQNLTVLTADHGYQNSNTSAGFVAEVFRLTS